MFLKILEGVFIPFLGTTLGALCVFFLKNGVGAKMQKALNGFAGGVMIAASVWSLLIPAINESAHLGTLSFIPAVVGFFGGIFFLFFLDKAVPHTHLNEQSEGPRASFGKNTMLFFAVTLHNIPEGVVVGIVFASILTGGAEISLAEAFALSIGIAIQNFPEGAIISMPLASDNRSRAKSFLWGVVSGIVEPISALLTILFCELLLPIFPYLLAFAAGAMIFVVVEELIPEMTDGDHKADIGTIMFALGFSILMILDVALG